MKKILNCLALLAAISCGPVVKTTSVQEEEEVNIGYGTIPSGQLTTSISTVKGDQHTPYSNIFEMIQGKCAGVVVNGTSIIIRGVGTINLSSQPLFIVDGTEMLDISHISPYDVKDINILKDSAASIYGSRGANGVIIITLK